MIRVSFLISDFTILKPLRKENRFILISALFPNLIKSATLDQVIIVILTIVYFLNIKSEPRIYERSRNYYDTIKLS